MQSPKAPLSSEDKARFLANVQRDNAAREATYREQALKLYPHVCARCGREFSGKRLRELTVHHRDSDHMNNPPDGSNWELLCLYCHDYEHELHDQRDHYDGSPLGGARETLGFKAFEGLKSLLKTEDSPSTAPEADSAEDR